MNAGDRDETALNDCLRGDDDLSIFRNFKVADERFWFNKRGLTNGV